MEIEDFKLAIEHVMEGKKHKMTINPKTITVELARPKAKKPVEDIYDYSNNKQKIIWKRSGIQLNLYFNWQSKMKKSKNYTLN